MGAFRPEEIYEALFDEQAFLRLPQVLARAGNGRSALLHWRHSEGAYETLAYDHFTPELMDDYDKTFRVIDPWVVAVFSSRKRNTALNMDRLLPAPIFQNSAAFNDCIRVHGDDTMHCIAAVMETPWGQGILGVHRGRGAPDFSDADVDSLQRAIDVLSRVLQVRGEIIAHRRDLDIAKASLDVFGQAMIVVCQDGRVLEANPSSEAVLRREDGLVIKDGVLRCVRQSDTLRLAELIAAATNRTAPHAGTMVISRSENADYLLTVSPLIRHSSRTAALLVFRDPDAVDDTLANRLRSLFGFTPSEADIAADLGRARSTAQIMAARRVSRNTLKTQLRSIAAKMRVGRISEIAATVAALPPLSES
ncbi:MAG TPA: hypothetical protein VMU37_07690 [Caulobacteraceae bacterium]|nr:hypothetical protein [Caulobacteraceae bacterium]